MVRTTVGKSGKRRPIPGFHLLQGTLIHKPFPQDQVSRGSDVDMDMLNHTLGEKPAPTNDRLYLFENIAASSSLIMICVLALVGNGAVLIIIVKHPPMRNVVNAFVASLSTSDLLASAFLMPLTLTVILKKGWAPGETLCLLHNYLNSVSGISSNWTMAFIACEKYMSVAYRSNWTVSKIKASLLIGASWICAIFISVPWDVGQKLFVGTVSSLEIRFNLETSYCYSFLKSSNTAETCRYVILIALGYATPFVIMTRCFVVITNNVKSTNLKIRPATVAYNQILFQAEMKAAVTVLVMLAIYALCWLPYIIVTILSCISHSPIPETLHNVTLWITWLDKAINPIIYAMRNRTTTCFARGRKHCGCWCKGGGRGVYIASDSNNRISFTSESCRHPTSFRVSPPCLSAVSELTFMSISHVTI